MAHPGLHHTIASPSNAPTVTPVIATKDKQQSDACVNDSHLPQDDILNDLSGCDDSHNKGDDSLDSFSGFSDPGGRFAITTDSVHCHHLPGFIRPDAESCPGRIEENVSPKNYFPFSLFPKLPYPFLGACIWKVHQVVFPSDSMCLSCIQRETHHQKSVSLL